jgi:pyridoxine kinase
MAIVLILGSHVASSRVGGTLASLALGLSPYEIEPIHVPTTLLGRHPGWGPPGGGAVSSEIFAGMLEGIAANGLFAGLDAVLTNYFASADQVEIAARAIDAIKAANPKAIILVDPVMGDAPAGLYVKEEIAAALCEHLVPRADYVTPNLWELGYMTGLSTETLPQIRFAARHLGRVCLVTSVPLDRQIGTVLIDGAAQSACGHDLLQGVPKGTGDLFATLFLGHLVQSRQAHEALARATAGTFCAIQKAMDWQTSDLPIVALGPALWECEPIRLLPT